MQMITVAVPAQVSTFDVAGERLALALAQRRGLQLQVAVPTLE
jgi:hypothetical protein